MKRSDRIKLSFIRNWKLPGSERMSRWFKPTKSITANLKDGITWLTDEDIAIYTTVNNYIEWVILSTGTYENEISKLIRLSLKPGCVALDIGANIGLNTLRMSQCIGFDGKVYAFEPLVHLQEKFKKNILLNIASNVKLMPFALSDRENVQDFNVDKNTWNQGTFDIGGKGKGNEIQEVCIRIADNIPEIRDLSRLDLVKIDVEGFEYQVLKGLKNTLEKYKPRLIFEIDPNYWSAGGQELGECVNYLWSFGYIIYQISSVGCELVSDVTKIKHRNLFCI